MNILCVIDSLGSGGAQRQLTRLAISFKRLGHKVEFLTYYQNDFFEHELKNERINIKKIQANNIIERIIKIRKIIRNGDQDLVISFLDTPNFLVGISALGGRKWSFIAGERSANIIAFNKWPNKIKKRMACLADFIVCNSRNAENIWRKKYPKYSDKLKTIYNSVYIPSTVNEIEYLPRRNGKINILVAASYRKVKNLKGLIIAVSKLSLHERNQIVINWYGQIKTSDKGVYLEAKKLISNLNLQNVILLHEENKEIYSLMKQADYVALFSTYEGLPNCICEGMMLSKPIIMSKVSDYDVLVDESNGYLCDAEDYNSIKEALQKAINTSNSTLLKMGEASKKKAIRLFDCNKNAKAYLELLNTSNN